MLYKLGDFNAAILVGTNFSVAIHRKDICYKHTTIIKFLYPDLKITK